MSFNIVITLPTMFIVLNGLCMISLRVSATKLVNKNEPEEIPKEFPSRLEASNEFYTVLAVVIFLTPYVKLGKVFQKNPI